MKDESLEIHLKLEFIFKIRRLQVGFILENQILYTLAVSFFVAYHLVLD